MTRGAARESRPCSSTMHKENGQTHQILLGELLNPPLGFASKDIHHPLIVEPCRCLQRSAKFLRSRIQNHSVQAVYRGLHVW